MARKSTGNSTPRNRKPSSPVESAIPSPVQQVNPVVSVPKSTATVAPKKTAVNLEDEIRRRAYEIFLERKGMAGDPNGDWFSAEREIRSREASQSHHSA